MPRTALLSLLVFVVGCQPAREVPAPADALAAGRWLDLTYDFSPETIYWPTSRAFTLEVVSAARTLAGFYYAANNFCAAEHGGTHLDAPVHFGEGRATADRIPLERLVGPAVVIDVAGEAAGDPDLLVGAALVERWEATHGRIDPGTIVLLRTGWGARWPDRARYLGTARLGPEAIPDLHFPGLDPAAARLLVERGADAVGIDTASIDRGQSTTFEAHQVLAAAEVPVFENVAHLDELPARGAFVVALPMKIRGGSGGPLRIVALLR
jgi:kynurenine formamidase